MELAGANYEGQGLSMNVNESSFFYSGNALSWRSYPSIKVKPDGDANASPGEARAGRGWWVGAGLAGEGVAHLGGFGGWLESTQKRACCPCPTNSALTLLPNSPPHLVRSVRHHQQPLSPGGVCGRRGPRHLWAAGALLRAGVHLVEPRGAWPACCRAYGDCKPPCHPRMVVMASPPLTTSNLLPTCSATR